MLKDVIKSMSVLLIFSIFFYNCDVYAYVCDTADIQRLKEMAKNVYVDYEYIELGQSEISDVNEDTEEGTILGVIDTYYVYISNLSNELYISVDGTNYYYDSVQDGILTIVHNSGLVEISVYSVNCFGEKLYSFTLNLPKFNKYSLTVECDQLKDLNLDICDKWYQGSLDDATFYNKIDKYLNLDGDTDMMNNIVNFFKKYYLFIIVGIVGLIIVAVIFLIHRKRSVLE